MGSPAPSARALKLLLDEMLDPEVAAQLRARGWDVESIQGEHPDLMGEPDDLVLEAAASLGRVLVTDSVRHFLPIHDAHLAGQRVHAGLLLAASRAYPRSKRTIGLWVAGIEAALKRLGDASTENLCEWLD